MSDYAALGSADSFDRLAAVLHEWVPRQRWFGGKARDLRRLRLVDAILITGATEPTPLFEVITEVEYDDGGTERYQVPLVPGVSADPGYVGDVDDIPLVDATYIPWAARILATLASEEGERRTARGDILYGAPVAPAALPDDPPRRMTAEQSNTSMVMGDAAILKIFRRLEPGENPDVEITRALTEAGFPNVPHQHGSFGVRHPDGTSTALGVLASFVRDGQEGWALATAEVARVTAGDAPTGMTQRCSQLGRAVARMHGVLARTLGAREATPGDLEHVADGMRTQVEQVLATAGRRAPDATAATLRRRGEIFERIERLAADKATGPLTRTHGDLHLGQVLLDADGDWQLLDFEGEPAKPLQDRQALQPPLRDVAGMLRSFDYAAASGSGGDLSDVPEAAAAWRDAARRQFLDGYLDAARSEDVLPHEAAAVQAQLDAFELDKAVYELGYELANRPDWVGIPLGGIARVLDRAA